MALTSRLLRTHHSLCRQRHVTESHPAPRLYNTQHTHICDITVSINQSTNITNYYCYSMSTTCQSSLYVVFTAQCTLVQMRGLGIACRLPVCLSVCLSVRLSVTLVICDHIGWKSWKLIARAISPTSSLIVAKRRSTYSQGNMGKFGGD